jgi:hypothetical protein
VRTMTVRNPMAKYIQRRPAEGFPSDECGTRGGELEVGTAADKQANRRPKPVVCKTKIVRDVMSFRNVPLVIRKTHHV